MQQPTDVDSALNFARLKELVTLGKSNNGQEVEKFPELKSRVLMGVPNSQLTTIFLASSQLTINFGKLLTFTFLQRTLFHHNPTFNESLNLQIPSLVGCFKKINAFLVFSVCFGKTIHVK